MCRFADLNLSDSLTLLCCHVVLAMLETSFPNIHDTLGHFCKSSIIFNVTVPVKMGYLSVVNEGSAFL